MFDKLEKYYTSLKESFNSNEPSYHFNEDRSHNATVMRFMFDNSSEIKMYCGELSILRDGFYDKIDNRYANEIKNLLSNSFRKFLNKESAKLSIILESYSINVLNDLICKDLFIDKLRDGKIVLYRLNDNFSFKSDINHFCFSDTRIVRFEEDKMKHSAICVFNNEEYSNMMKKNFEKLETIAIKIN